MSTKRLTRREFLRVTGLTGAGLIAAACAPVPPAVPTSAPATAPATAVPAAAAGSSFGNGVPSHTSARTRRARDGRYSQDCASAGTSLKRDGCCRMPASH